MLSKITFVVVNLLLAAFAAFGLLHVVGEISGRTVGGRVYMLCNHKVIDLVKACEYKAEWCGEDATYAIGRWISAHYISALAVVSFVALLVASYNLWYVARHP